MPFPSGTKCLSSVVNTGASPLSSGSCAPALELPAGSQARWRGDIAVATATSLQSTRQNSWWEDPEAPSDCMRLWLDTSLAAPVLPSRSWDTAPQQGLGSRGTARGSPWPGQAVLWITVAYQRNSPRLGADLPGRGCFLSLRTHRHVFVSVRLCAHSHAYTYIHMLKNGVCTE